jgi:hypothetical protein
MVVVSQQPGTYSFSKNPIIYKLENKENGIIKRSEAARSDLVVDNVISGPLNTVFQNNQVLTLKITKPLGEVIEQEYTFKDQADPTDREQIPTTNTIAQIIEQIATHYIIAPYVSVTYITDNDQYIITAEAKEIEADWIVEWKAAGYTITDTAFQAEPDTEGRYYVYFEKEFASSKWYEVFEGTILINGDEGEQIITIEKIIDAEGINSIKLNPFSVYSKTQPTTSDNIRRYFLKAYIDNQLITKELKRVILGGLPQRVWQQSNFFANAGAHNSFLTYQPNFKQLPPSGVEYITWFNYSSEMKQARLRVKYFGAAELELSYFNNNFVQSGMCLTFPVSPAALSLPDGTTHYEIQVINANADVLSPTRTYLIDKNAYGVRQLAYLNAFGCPEVAHCYGIRAVMVTVTASEWEELKIKATGAVIQVNKRISESYTRKFTYRTGIITKALKEVYSELALSPSVFDISGEHYQGFILTNVKNRDEIIFEEGQSLYGWQWEFSELVQSDNFGNDKLHYLVGDMNESIVSSVTDPFANIIDEPGAPQVSGLNDNDLIVFALLDNNGNYSGQKYVKSADYMRYIRGLPTTAGSHLDGLAFKNSEEEIWLQTIDNAGNPDYKKQ